MRRTLIELAVVAACVLAGIALALLQTSTLHMTAGTYLLLVFVAGGIALAVGLRIERRLSLNENRPRSPRGRVLQDRRVKDDARGRF